MTEKTEILNEAGLTNWESRAFISLIELGETTTGPLVEKSKIPQSKIYSILESLINKGLVSYVLKGKIKYFQASNPEKIYLMYKERENKIKKEVERLASFKKGEKEKTIVNVFEGMKAIRLINSELIQKAKKGEEFYGYSEGIGYSKEINEFYHTFGELRRIAGIKDLLLITQDSKKEFEKSVSKEDLNYVKKKTRYCSVKFPQDTAIFRENVIIYSWEEIPKAIIIKSKPISESYKAFFLSLWKTAKK
ncbi:MAG TPA: helix-turn-helix domain-containing protein [Candidatus Paceibacterota bacterium]|nr:helix-turn-helix domain-containing protein [Candidatus Paceibacterota bacterium]